MIGAIPCDIIGSPYEFDRGNMSKYSPLFSENSAYTDETVIPLPLEWHFLTLSPMRPTI